MYYLYVVLTISLLALLAAGVIEQRRHDANLDSIPVRVLVNGIRGKSSITRLCAGALRGGELRVVAKTTGSAARLIWPDATEEAVHRKFEIANIVEQIDIVRQAAAAEAQALVMECMAVMPALQETNQRKLVRSTIGIICNVREDHLTEMGPTLEDVARSLSRSMPHGGTCITAEREWLHVLQQEADQRDCRLIAVDPEGVTDEELDRFEYFTFKENVAIALQLAHEVGISRQDALTGMWAAPPDPGVLTVEEYHVGDKRLRFANLFAANDPSSTLMIARDLLERGEIRPPIFTLINCRPDRIERNGQMGSIVADLLTEKLFIIGHPTRSARPATGWSGPTIELDGGDPSEVFRRLLEEVDREASVLAVGNIHGDGERLLEHLEGLGAVR